VIWKSHHYAPAATKSIYLIYYPAAATKSIDYVAVAVAIAVAIAIAVAVFAHLSLAQHCNQKTQARKNLMLTPCC
jgi:hypothetical protein